ncbi:MAG TPA: polysaccharide deacetylase family protein [Steroidobacteraceae bacterium]|jgi:peptidoglycan/xylan/chitin deacetylase (PgdA/CDA1 family)
MTLATESSATLIGIAFHGIGEPHPGLSDADQGYFVSRDFFLALLDEIAGRPDVELSFDDGYASDVEMALPALVERSMTARFFPVAGRLRQPGFVDAAGIEALSSAGMMIGSHGMRHRSWRALNADSMDEEVSQARSIIAEVAGKNVTTAACPFGAYDRHVLRTLRSSGYTKVFTSDRRRAERSAWLQPRYAVKRGDSLQTVRRDILAPQPMHDRVRRAVAAQLKAWR